MSESEQDSKPGKTVQLKPITDPKTIETIKCMFALASVLADLGDSQVQLTMGEIPTASESRREAALKALIATDGQDGDERHKAVSYLAN
ncbi:MAG: hypothetical protein VCA73_16275, partial [Roseibacillus sp.]